MGLTGTVSVAWLELSVCVSIPHRDRLCGCAEDVCMHVQSGELWP